MTGRGGRRTGRAQRRPVGAAARAVPRASRSRRWGPWAALLIVAVGGLVAQLSRPAADLTAGGETVTVSVSDPLTADVDGGRVDLAITAEVPADAGALEAVPAGVPATLELRLPDGVDVADTASPLTAQRAPAAGTDGEIAPVEVDLLGDEVFLLNREIGTLSLPNPVTTGDDSHAHDPGQGLASTIRGGGWAWTTRVRPDPDDVVVDPGGRFLALVHADDLEFVDLLRREPPARIALPAAPVTASFDARGSRLWVATGDGVHVVDPTTGATVSTLDGVEATRVVAVDAGMLLVDDRGGVSFTDHDADGVLATARSPAPVADAVAADGDLLVASGDRQLAVVSPSDAGLDVTTIDLPLDADHVAADEQHAIVLDEAGDRAAVVDLATRTVVGEAETGRGPAETAFLDGFAIVRNSGSPDLTWIDLAEPERSNQLELGDDPATSLAPSPSGREIYATSPDEQLRYEAHVMMGRPMVMGQVPDTSAADQVIATRGGLVPLGEGAHRLRTSFPDPGRYQLDVATTAGTASFDLVVEPAPSSGPTASPVVTRVEATAGQPVTVGFTVSGPQLGTPQVVAIATDRSGTRQVRVAAAPAGDGRYEATLELHGPASYQVRLLDEATGLTATRSTVGWVDVAAVGDTDTP